MSGRRWKRLAALTSLLWLALQAGGQASARACTVCFGDGDQTPGLGAGIVLLLGLVLLIQVALGVFFWRLRRSERAGLSILSREPSQGVRE